LAFHLVRFVRLLFAFALDGDLEGRRPQRIAGTRPLREGRKGPLRMTSWGGIQRLGAYVRCSPYAASVTSSLRRSRGFFLACFETSFEDWSWPGMFRRDELRRAGTCGVDVGSYRMVRVSGDGVQQEGLALETLVVAWSGRFRASLTKSSLSTRLGQLSSCALAPLEKAEGGVGYSTSLVGYPTTAHQSAPNLGCSVPPTTQVVKHRN